MFKLRSIAARLMLAISLTVAAACGILGTFSIIQQRTLTQLALDQQLKLQYDSVIAALDYEGRAALAVSAVIATLPPVAEAVARGDRDALMALLQAPFAAIKAHAAGNRLLPCSRAETVRRRHLQPAQDRGGIEQHRQADRRRRTRAGFAGHFRHDTDHARRKEHRRRRHRRFLWQAVRR
jgi:hypothetical protein